jgi:hypothetical protein
MRGDTWISWVDAAALDLQFPSRSILHSVGDRALPDVGIDRTPTDVSAPRARSAVIPKLE